MIHEEGILAIDASMKRCSEVLEAIKREATVLELSDYQVKRRKWHENALLELNYSANMLIQAQKDYNDHYSDQTRQEWNI